MKTRILGKSNLEVSAMGLGCGAIGGPYYNRRGHIIPYGQVIDADSIKAIHRALDLGITLFDTANVYGGGRSERVLGEALKGRREEVVIATKFGVKWDTNSNDPDVPCRVIGRENSPEAIRKACKDSLQRLQTDYIDLYQLHSPDLALEIAINVKDTLEELVEDGSIRYYGWSTNYPDKGKIFAGGKHCAIVQFRLHFTRSNTGMLSLLDDFNLAGLINGPLGRGLFTGKYKADSTVPRNHGWHGTNFAEEPWVGLITTIDKLQEILKSEELTPAQAALGYIWSQHDRLIPIPGFKNVKQVEENAEALEFGPLPKDLVKQIDDLFAEYRKDFREIQEERKNLTKKV